MKTLFLLIALYTITSKQAVPSGDIPAGSSCAYEQSGNRSGQLTADNELILTLNGYDGIQLQSVTLSMKSNTSAGAGQLQLKVGETSVWNISDAPFSSSSWAGAYSTEWVNLTHSLGGMIVPQDAPITLHIKASQNSLYLQSVAVEYAGQQAEAHTVAFNTHVSQRVSSITEEQPDGGVILPDFVLEDEDWLFLGWSPVPVDESEQLPTVFTPGSVYHPAEDCTMHAVYAQYGEQQPWLPTDDLTQQDYLIALYEPVNQTLWTATGDVQKGMIASVTKTIAAEDGWVAMPHELCTDNAVYTIAVTHDTLTIRHKASNSLVALAADAGGKFAKTNSGLPWKITADQTDGAMPAYDVYGMIGTQAYYISCYLANDANIYFRPTKYADQRHDILFYALSDRMATASLYSSYPFGDALPVNHPDAGQVYTVQIGPCVMTIINGKKYLQINE